MAIVNNELMIDSNTINLLEKVAIQAFKLH